MTTDKDYFKGEVSEELAGERLDKALAQLIAEEGLDLSRSRIKALIQGSQVSIDETVMESPSIKLKAGQEIELIIPPAESYAVAAENIPLDVVFEDEHLLVINKAAGMVVHPGAGNWTGTLVHALLHHCGDSLSGIGGVMRPGIVHRLDKDTSGLMIVAKNDRAHKYLSAQLADRSLTRQYIALVIGVPIPMRGRIDFPLGRHPRDRVRIAIRLTSGKEAVTHYERLESYGEALSLVMCKLETGRTHQIRVHMEAIGHPLIGDSLYSIQPTKLASMLRKAGFSEEIHQKLAEFPRQALHAKTIAFIHPESKEEMRFDSELPEDFQSLLNALK